MKRIIILCFSLCFIACSKNEVNIEESNNLEFTTQADLNNFSISEEEIIDTLKISGEDISDLSAFRELTQINNLIIDGNPKLTNLKGLGNIQAINQMLIIKNNRSLGDFEALKNLNVENLISNNNVSETNFVYTKQSQSENVIQNGNVIIEKNLFNPILETLNTNFTVPENVYNGNITIRSKEELDNFIAEKYTLVNGFFKIKYNLNITSLLGLESLKLVRDEVEFTKLGIENLNGLENLSSAGNLGISELHLITDLNGIENLQFIGRSIGIYNNDAIENLQGLENLNSVEGYLSISGNKNLTHLTNLDSLHFVGKDLPDPDFFTDRRFGGIVIQENPKLLSLEGLENTVTIEGDLIIQDNDNLQDLFGLYGIEKIEGVVRIESNDSMLNLNGLNNLEYIAGKTFIQKNKSLISLEGLNNKLIDLYIGNNQSLESLKGLAINRIETLSIIENSALKTLDGLNNLEKAVILKIENNNSLESVFGLEKLVEINSNFIIRSNSNLVDFCSINPSFEIYNQFNSSYDVRDNGYNPSRVEIISEDKCKLQ